MENIYENSYLEKSQKSTKSRINILPLRKHPQRKGSEIYNSNNISGQLHQKNNPGYNVLGAQVRQNIGLRPRAESLQHNIPSEILQSKTPSTIQLPSIDERNSNSYVNLNTTQKLNAKSSRLRLMLNVQSSSTLEEDINKNEYSTGGRDSLTQQKQFQNFTMRRQSQYSQQSQQQKFFNKNDLNQTVQIHHDHDANNISK